MTQPGDARFFARRGPHSLAAVAAASADRFPRLELFTIEDVFGGWQKAQKEHFSDGGIFDKITAK